MLESFVPNKILMNFKKIHLEKSEDITLFEVNPIINCLKVSM